MEQLDYPLNDHIYINDYYSYLMRFPELDNSKSIISSDKSYYHLGFHPFR